MVSLVRSEVAHVLGLASDQEIGDDAGLFALGLDSLMAVQVRRRLARVADLTLPATLLFNHPTVSALSSFLLEALSADADSERDLAPNAPSLPDAVQASNSDGDVHALLLEEIARLPADLLRGRGGAGQAS
jgi:aryl carrier-like protein